MPERPGELLQKYLSLLTDPALSGDILDLACGTGRNGLLLARHGIPVVFADHSTHALQVVKQHLFANALPGRIWHIDLEQADINPFTGHKFAAVIVFRYLHRPLFPGLKNAIYPGGLVVYETFTVDNRHFGKPDNPEFLLQKGELKALFQDWTIIFYAEGILPEPKRAVAQIVARKPATLNRCVS